MSHPVPPDRLYFAVLPPPVSPRGRARREELTYALEATVPVPIDSVHARYRALPDGRVLAVGIDRNHAAEIARTHAAAHPAAWPDWLCPHVGETSAEGLNLLTGPCRSPRTTAAGSTALRHALLGFILIALLASVGLERRIRSDAAPATESRLQTAAVYTQALGPASNPAQPPAARMTSELRRLRATRGLQPASAPARTADTVLADLLTAWPEGAQARTESITIAERTVEVILRLDDLETAQTFITALGAAPGLRPGPANTDREADEVRLSLRFDREAAP